MRGLETSLEDGIFRSWFMLLIATAGYMGASFDSANTFYDGRNVFNSFQITCALILCLSHAFLDFRKERNLESERLATVRLPLARFLNSKIAGPDSLDRVDC